MMGAPIEEHFQSGNEENRFYMCEGVNKKKIGDTDYCLSKRVDSIEDSELPDWSSSEYNEWNYDCSEDVAITEGTGSNKKLFCKKLNEGSNSELNSVLNSESEENSGLQTTSALDPEEVEAEAENSGSSETTPASEESEENNKENNNNNENNNNEENNNEDEDEEEDDEENEDDEEDDEEDEEDEEENFTGSMNIEHFSGKQIQARVLNLNLLLKSLLFACLFYIVAHQDTKTYLLKNLKFLKGFDYLIVSMVIYFVCYYMLSIFV